MVKRLKHSSRDPGVTFPALTWPLYDMVLISSVTPVQGNLMSSLASEGTRHVHGAYT